MFLCVGCWWWIYVGIYEDIYLKDGSLVYIDGVLCVVDCIVVFVDDFYLRYFSLFWNFLYYIMIFFVEFNGLNGYVVNGNGVNGYEFRFFVLKDIFVENFCLFWVIVVGVGFFGILVVIRIFEWLRNVELVVYEKVDGVGGVW